MEKDSNSKMSLSIENLLLNMNNNIIELKQEISQKFREINQKFDVLTQRIDDLDSKYDQLYEGQIQLKKQREIDSQNIAKILEEQTKLRIMLQNHINEPYETAHRNKKRKLQVM